MRSVIQIPLSQGRWEQYVEVALAAVLGVTVIANIGSSGLIVSARVQQFQQTLITADSGADEISTSTSISESGLHQL